MCHNTIRSNMLDPFARIKMKRIRIRKIQTFFVLFFYEMNIYISKNDLFCYLWLFMCVKEKCIYFLIHDFLTILVAFCMIFLIIGYPDLFPDPGSRSKTLLKWLAMFNLTKKRIYTFYWPSIYTLSRPRLL